MIQHDYTDSTQALRAMTNGLKCLLEQLSPEGIFHLALSGGGTAQKMFALWAAEYADAIDWSRIRFYWVDERCVSPHDEESNYGHAQQLLFQPLQIPDSHVFRIRGEADPEVEAVRYALLVEQLLARRNATPYFDAIILGVGPDAHTASIFPNNLGLLTDTRLYAVARHPATAQQRITMTGTLLLNDTPLFVPILGADKQPVVDLLKQGYSPTNALPAAYIIDHARQATVYTSQD